MNYNHKFINIIAINALLPLLRSFVESTALLLIDGFVFFMLVGGGDDDLTRRRESTARLLPLGTYTHCIRSVLGPKRLVYIFFKKYI